MLVNKSLLVLMLATLQLFASGTKEIDGGNLCSIRKSLGDEVLNIHDSNIGIGGGYSEDSQQIAPERCYNAIISSKSDQTGFVKLDAAMSYSQIQNYLGVSATVETSFLFFSADAHTSYMRSLQDDDYTLSLNYYAYATNDVSLQLAGAGENALTQAGKEFYNSGKNPYFGLLCGDNYITSYKQGALLTMALVIKFNSTVAKHSFEETAGGSFGDLVSVSETVKKYAGKSNMAGSVVLQAFQKGGDPSQLSKILSGDSSGKYNGVSCSLTSLDNCAKAAKGLLDYARNNFPNQISFKNNTGLSPLGLAFTQYIPISYIGLTPPKSFVTKEVAKSRDQLFEKLRENEYYLRKFYPFTNKEFPVTVDAEFVKNANSIVSKANKNINILMQAHNGAADCYNFPDRCESIKTKIYSQMVNITANDFAFLEDMKYKI